MSCHEESEAPVVGASLDDADTYKVSALTGAVNANGDPTLRLNCDELRRAYEVSCASSQASFRQFASEVQASADSAAAPIFGPANGVNDAFIDSDQAQRIMIIRICVRWRWIRIYIVWKI